MTDRKRKKKFAPTLGKRTKQLAPTAMALAAAAAAAQGAGATSASGQEDVDSRQAIVETMIEKQQELQEKERIDRQRRDAVQEQMRQRQRQAQIADESTPEEREQQQALQKAQREAAILDAKIARRKAMPARSTPRVSMPPKVKATNLPLFADLARRNASVGEVVMVGRLRSMTALGKKKAVAAPKDEAPPPPRTDTVSAADRVALRKAREAEKAQESAMAVQTTLVNGRIVVDEATTNVVVAVPSRVEPSNAREVGQRASYASYTNRLTPDKWSLEATQEFYNGLRQFGADFSLLEKLFPNRTRKQLKNKFKREEKINRELVEEALENRIPIDMVAFREKCATAPSKKKK